MQKSVPVRSNEDTKRRLLKKCAEIEIEIVETILVVTFARHKVK